MASQQSQIQKWRDDLNKKLREQNAVTNVLGQIEEKTGVDRLYIVAASGVFILIMLLIGNIGKLICTLVGSVYPSYMSIKAIESPQKSDDTQWLTYWVVFALFNVVEFGADVIVGWFPIYWVVKCAAMLYLALPMTRGAEKMYVRFVRPFMQKYQETIDKRLGKAAGKVTDAIRTEMEHAHEN